MANSKILIVDDEYLIRWSLGKDLRKAGYETHEAASGEDALGIIEKEKPDLVLLDLKMSGMDGFKVMAEVQRKGIDLLFIIVTGIGDVKTAVRAVKAGAIDYICKPFEIEDVKLRIEMALETARMKQELAGLKEELKGRYGFDNLIGESSSMKEIVSTIKKVAASKFSTVLLQGESGTGKDLIAKTIHALSDRGVQVFLDINCSAFPETLLESELFGHEKGAFTGAGSQKKGLLELADGGTAYLDEIGDMPFTLQGKLLKVLETKTFRRLGGTKEISVDARIIAATNKRLKIEVKEGRFRNDLFFRLQVIPIDLPPLREHPEDIPKLIQFFIDKFNREFKKSVKGISPEALELLKRYQWPGNVRELRNVVERVLILETAEHIKVENLPPEIASFDQTGKAENLVDALPPHGNIS